VIPGEHNAVDGVQRAPGAKHDSEHAIPPQENNPAFGSHPVKAAGCPDMGGLGGANRGKNTQGDRDNAKRQIDKCGHCFADGYTCSSKPDSL
jgi:hypothetical protein